MEVDEVHDVGYVDVLQLGSKRVGVKFGYAAVDVDVLFSLADRKILHVDNFVVVFDDGRPDVPKRVTDTDERFVYLCIDGRFALEVVADIAGYADVALVFDVGFAVPAQSRRHFVVLRVGIEIDAHGFAFDEAFPLKAGLQECSSSLRPAVDVLQLLACNLQLGYVHLQGYMSDGIAYRAFEGASLWHTEV